MAPLRMPCGVATWPSSLRLFGLVLVLLEIPIQSFEHYLVVVVNVHTGFELRGRWGRYSPQPRLADARWLI